MKIKLLIFLFFLFVIESIGFAQGTPKESKLFPFAQYNDPTLSLISQVDNPAEYRRYNSDNLTVFQHWLSNLPLMPPKTPVLNWKGKIISKADTLNRVVDMNIESEYVTDADIPVLLLMHFFRLQGKLEDFKIILKENLVVKYRDWLRGKYIDEEKRAIYFRNEGISRADSDEEFQKYIEFVTEHFDIKSLRMNVKHVDSRVFRPSQILLHYDVENPDKIGHAAIILDVAIGKKLPRKMLIAYGGNPAQSVIIPNSGKARDGRWFSLDEIREHLNEYGLGYIYRWKVD